MKSAPKNHAEHLRTEIRSHVKSMKRKQVRMASKTKRLALPGQPFDTHYLEKSPLFAFSRATFLKNGGKFRSELTTTPRSLSSAVLLTNEISYSPIESEMIWTATDPEESKNDQALLTLASYATSTFHEQNHRILWKFLPKPADLSEGGLRRYLNFVESLVITLDSLLGDTLGPDASRLAFLSGVLYDPGTKIRFHMPRDRMNYLHALLRATYYTLEDYDREKILSAIPSLHPELTPEVARLAAERAMRLDVMFVRYTNPTWQERNHAVVKKALTPRKGEKTLTISRDPVEFLEPYVWAEKVLSLYLKKTTS